MEAPPYYAPLQHQNDHSSHPTIGFPLGTALLMFIIFTLSGIFSCCYHYDKLRHLRGDLSDAHPNSSQGNRHHSATKPQPVYSEKKQGEDQSLPVIMAGDQFVRFIAMPCPCEPPKQEKVTTKVIQTPPKPPHIAIPMY